MAKDNSIGNVLLFTGPHGAGKDTLEAAFRNRTPNTTRIVRHITRPPAPGEQDGHDYHFVSDQEFSHLVTADEFIEYAAYVGVKSGTSRGEIMRKTRESTFATLTCNFEDGLMLHQKLGSVGVTSLCLFISPVSEQTIHDDPDAYIAGVRSRLEERGRSTDLVEGRLAKAALYRELYLATPNVATYIDNRNGNLTEAITAVSAAAAKLVNSAGQ